MVLSGHGLHLYYVLETPIRATMNNIRKLNKLKEGMTKLIWNRYTSNIEKIQFQYCLQGFRMVGSASKMGNATQFEPTDLVISITRLKN